MIVVNDVDNVYSRKHMTMLISVGSDSPVRVMFEVVDMKYCAYVEHIRIHGSVKSGVKSKIRQFIKMHYEYNLKAPV